MTSPVSGLAGNERAARWRFTADDVMKMLDAGVLHEDDPVELIDGELLIVSPQGPEHIALKDELRERLREAYAGRAHIRDQGPLRADDRSLPEPGLCVLRGAPRDYLTRHATGADAVLVVELAKTSQTRDRRKASVYARAGVPVYWLLDLEERTLTVHSRPNEASSAYGDVVVLGADDRVELPESDAAWTVATMLA
jgi:Uma2 family endonuclease